MCVNGVDVFGRTHVHTFLDVRARGHVLAVFGLFRISEFLSFRFRIFGFSEFQISDFGFSDFGRIPSPGPVRSVRSDVARHNYAIGSSNRVDLSP